MGEIADALRRAREAGGSSSAPAAPARAEVPLRVTGPLEGDLRHEEETGGFEPPAEGHWVDALAPTNDAVMPDDGPHAEVCRQIALRLREELDEKGARSVLIGSSERGDGKTTVACNLAVALASLSRGRDVALVDLDMRRPAVADALSLHPDVGIEQVLLGKASLDDVRISVRYPAIDVYPAVTPQRAAHELLVQPSLVELLGRLQRIYGTVVVDSPPAPLVPDANLLLRHVDFCVPVVRKGKTRGRSLRRLAECLPRKQLLGWVMNCDQSHRVREEDYYYYGAEGAQSEAPAGGRRFGLGRLIGGGRT